MILVEDRGDQVCPEAAPVGLLASAISIFGSGWPPADYLSRRRLSCLTDVAAWRVPDDVRGDKSFRARPHRSATPARAPRSRLLDLEDGAVTPSNEAESTALAMVLKHVAGRPGGLFVAVRAARSSAPWGADATTRRLFERLLEEKEEQADASAWRGR
jgi:hypothetical protein